MKLRILAVIGLLAIAVGAVFFSLGGQGLFASTTASQYLTATAAVSNVVKDVAAILRAISLDLNEQGLMV